MRLPKHHQLTFANGRRQAVTDLGLAPGQVRRFAQCSVDGVWGQVWVKALPEGDFLFLSGNVGLPYSGPLYAKSWTMEQCFQNLKGRGFNLEASHLRCRHKLHKLVVLVSLAYALCLGVGTVAHARRAPIARKNHGYPATRLSRHGLNILRQLTRPGASPHKPMGQMVDALLRWISRKTARYQPTKIVG